MKGDVCHWTFEILIMHKHRYLVEKVVQAGTVTVDRALERLIKLFIKKAGLPDYSSIFLQIDKMILVGLSNDFLPKGGVLVSPEFKFDITKPTFRIKGFMDKPFIRGNILYIDDYKSSKQKFKGEDEESNMQALMYSYAARQLWPDLKPVVRFIFLQYPDDPIMTVQFNDSTLKGFEMYLENIQERVNMFNENSAKSNFAADVEPHDNSFNGKLMCGFAKTPNQLKKDGTKMWYCPYKFAFDYYVIKKGGKIVYSVFTEEEIKPLKEGETVEKMKYAGCPRHRNHLTGFNIAPKLAPKKFPNIIDSI